ncbi:MAG: hypothetical protein FD180_4237 [Planctomycetota bacterium]|nr:MAG: hypothetical protein FD180_4237 [Planctomycetota bacterium]
MLSDDAVIARLNAEYVPVTVNITDAGWPDDSPALAPWTWGYDAWPFSKLGFVNALVCDPSGRLPYAWAGSGMKAEFETSANYHPDIFLKFLDRADAHRALVNGIHESAIPVEERRKLIRAMLASEFGTSEDRVEWFIRKRMREDVLD